MSNLLRLIQTMKPPRKKKKSNLIVGHEEEYTYVTVTGRKRTLFLSLFDYPFDFAMLELCQLVSQKAQIWFSVSPIYLLKMYQIRA